ncbi:MAG: hypothetical protein JSV68_11025, partial [Anaerolineaceae bacterium]
MLYNKRHDQQQWATFGRFPHEAQMTRLPSHNTTNPAVSRPKPANAAIAIGWAIGAPPSGGTVWIWVMQK